MELTTSMVLREQTFEGKTYKVLPCKIEGYVHDLEALKQAIYKVLATEQFEYPVYSFNYGIAWKELIGEEQPYVRAEMKRLIQEALLHDDRIREVDGFSFSFTGDTCQCRATWIRGKEASYMTLWRRVRTFWHSRISNWKTIWI